MTKDETIRGIATYIDHPNVYMGGPSRDALRKANLIFDYLEIDRLSRQLAEAQEALESLLCVCDLATHDSYNIYRAVEMAKSKLAQSAAMGTTDASS